MYVLYIFYRRPEDRDLSQRRDGSPRKGGAMPNGPTARYVLPEFSERTSNGCRTLDPYSKLLDERIVFLGHRRSTTPRPTT